MEADLHQRAETLFKVVVDLDVEERRATLDRACDDDSQLRAEVESLLLADLQSEHFLRSPLQRSDEAEDAPPDRRIDGRIGRYRIRRLIATGGMGSVYEAEQDEPSRTVALKILKAGLTTRDGLRRFSLEAEILARLHHPGIAHIYEGGSHDDGTGSVPYFAMEFIAEARSLIEYATRNGLTNRERLDLFVQVCEAVHYGHQHGVIHRDLKPSNILIDARGAPKIIDFGVARATNADMTAATLQTTTGQIVGTLRYMSPEQCTGDSRDVDIRSDVYSLGVVLYELMTGRLPYELDGIAAFDIPRTIRETEPTPPSAIEGALRGDLESIMLKALEKERGRRFQSAADLSADIQRLQHDEPITARPPSAIYQLRKFARRNKVLVGSGAAIGIVLVAATIVSTTLAFGQARARNEAVRQAAIATAVNEFLNEDVLGAASPWTQGIDVSMREVLDSASSRIEGRFEGEPLIEAAIRQTLGDTYLSVSEFSLAEPHIVRAVALRREHHGERHPDTLASLTSLAWMYQDVGRFDDAEPLLIQLLALRRSVHGNEHGQTLYAQNNLALLYLDQGRYDEAEPLHRRTLEQRRQVLGEDHPHTLQSMNNLALVYQRQGRYDVAKDLYHTLVERCRQVLGAKDPRTLFTEANLAETCLGLGALDEAESLCRQTIESMRTVLGPEQESTLEARVRLGRVYEAQGRGEEARDLLVQAMDDCRRALGDEHPHTLSAMHHAARMLRQDGRLEESETLLEAVVDKRQALLGREHPDTLDSINELAALYRAQGRFDEAEAILLPG